MCDVHREALAFQMRGEFGNLTPSPLKRALQQHLPGRIDHLGAVGIYRSRRVPAISAYECCHSLKQERAKNLRVIGKWDHPIGVRMHIDEAGRDDHPGRIDLARGTRLMTLTWRNQLGDFSAADGDL